MRKDAARNWQRIVDVGRQFVDDGDRCVWAAENE